MPEVLHRAPVSQPMPDFALMNGVAQDEFRAQFNSRQLVSPQETASREGAA